MRKTSTSIMDAFRSRLFGRTSGRPGPVLLALDGTAATTKTTILTRIMDRGGCRVHFEDYKEISDFMGLGENSVMDGVLYLMWRNERAHFGKRNLFDREPASTLLYRLVAADADEQTVRRYCQKVKRYGLNKNWRSVILLTVPGQEQLVVRAMAARNNGIDWLDAEYVVRQNRVFETWAEVMGYPCVYVDYTRDLGAQQLAVMKLVDAMFDEYNPLNWRERLFRVAVRLVGARRPRC